MPSFELPDGTQIWNSPSIIPSTAQLGSTATAPAWADPHSSPAAGAPRVDVYVRVTNTGADEVACPTGLWLDPADFTGIVLANAAPQTDSQHGWTFTASMAGDTLTRSGVTVSMPLTTSGRKCWGWSPDGHFFALAYEPSAGAGRNWHLVVVSLQGATRIDGTLLMPGAIVAQHPTTATASVAYNAPFDRTIFGWVGSSAIFTHGVDPAGTNDTRYLLCFRTHDPATGTPRPPVIDAVPAGTTWRYRASPCGSRLAILRPTTAAAEQDITWLSTETAGPVAARQGGVAVSVTTNGGAPTITTNAHTALGVSVFQGSGAPTLIDDPDDTRVFGGLTVHVDRVKASTLPSANLGVRLIGAGIAGVIPQGQSRWVQVPNRVGWNDEGESHWCLLAQGYDETAGIQRAWDGQAATPPPFPAQAPAVGNERCTQKNIHIAP